MARVLGHIYSREEIFTSNLQNQNICYIVKSVNFIMLVLDQLF